MIQVLDGSIGHTGRHLPELIDVREDQGIFADEIDDARNAMACLMDKLNSIWKEYLSGSAGDAKPPTHVFRGLL